MTLRGLLCDAISVRRWLSQSPETRGQSFAPLPASFPFRVARCKKGGWRAGIQLQIQQGPQSPSPQGRTTAVLPPGRDHLSNPFGRSSLSEVRGTCRTPRLELRALMGVDALYDAQECVHTPC